MSNYVGKIGNKQCRPKLAWVCKNPTKGMGPARTFTASDLNKQVILLSRVFLIAISAKRSAELQRIDMLAEVNLPHRVRRRPNIHEHTQVTFRYLITSCQCHTIGKV